MPKGEEFGMKKAFVAALSLFIVAFAGKQIYSGYEDAQERENDAVKRGIRQLQMHRDERRARVQELNEEDRIQDALQEDYDRKADKYHETYRKYWEFRDKMGRNSFPAEAPLLQEMQQTRSEFYRAMDKLHHIH